MSDKIIKSKLAVLNFQKWGKEGDIYTANFHDGSFNITEGLYQTLSFLKVMDVIIEHLRYKWLFFIPPPPLSKQNKYIDI